MKPAPLLRGAALPALAVLVALPAAVFAPRSLRASGFCDPLPFGSFTYSQRGAFGFCPEIGAIFSARISLVPDVVCPEDYILEMSVLEVGVPGVDTCLSGISGPEGVECVRETRLEARVLTADEVSAAFQTFAEAWGQIRSDPDPLCGVIDRCVIHVFAWEDPAGISDDECDSPRITSEGAEILLSLLERLRRGEVLSLENGDANGDTRRDISDAVYLLGWLFLGGPGPMAARCSGAPACPPEDVVIVQNGDVNGDGAIDLSDPVYLLGWLFLSGGAPAPLCSCQKPG